MKFTEGYWLPSEKANASHAMQAYEVEQIPGGCVSWLPHVRSITEA